MKAAAITVAMLAAFCALLFAYETWRQDPERVARAAEQAKQERIRAEVEAAYGVK